MKTFLFLFTFVFGTMRFMTFLKFFDIKIGPPLTSMFGLENNHRSLLLGFLVLCDNLFCYFAFGYQAFWWLTYLGIKI